MFTYNRTKAHFITSPSLLPSSRTASKNFDLSSTRLLRFVLEFFLTDFSTDGRKYAGRCESSVSSQPTLCALNLIFRDLDSIPSSIQQRGGCRGVHRMTAQERRRSRGECLGLIAAILYNNCNLR